MTPYVTQEEVIQTVRDRLAKHQPSDYRLDVLPEAVHEEDGWWYVAVGPDRKDIRRYDYYNVLAEVGQEIEDELELDITLVPPPSGVSL